MREVLNLYGKLKDANLIRKTKKLSFNPKNKENNIQSNISNYVAMALTLDSEYITAKRRREILVNRLRIENQIEVEEIIFSDPHRLRVILTNLISNSIKYADLAKERPSIGIDFTRHNGHHEIRIEDNGLGIAPDQLPKIFNMFYRASSISKGSGLGLYIAMESAEKLKYQIDVQSEVGVGSVFSIRIPV